MNKIIQKYRTMTVAAKAAIIYAFSNILIKGISIITVPLFTRIMPPSEIGVVTTYNTWQLILSAIITLSVTAGSLNVAMNEYKSERRAYESSVLVLSSISCGFFFLIYFLFRDFFNNLFTLPTVLVCLMFISIFFNVAMDIWMVHERFEYNYKTVFFISVVSNFISTTVAVIVVLAAKKKACGNLGMIRLFSSVGTIIVISIVIYICILFKGKTFFNFKYWKFAMTLSIPLIINSLAKNILDVSDKAMISIFCNKHAVGIYGTLYSLSSLSLIFWNAINNALMPVLFEHLEKGIENAKKVIREYMYPLLFFYGIVAVSITFVAPELIKIFATNEYYEAIYMIAPVSAGIFLTALYNIFGNVLLFYKKSIVLMVSTLIAAITNIALNYYFIPKYGYIAASYTTLVGYIILSLFQYFGLVVCRKSCLFDSRIILLVSFMIIAICLMCNLIYNHFLLRYSIILLCGLIILINYKKIRGILKKVRNGS